MAHDLQVARQLADPRPRDAATVGELASYRHLDPRWHDWATVRSSLAAVAVLMIRSAQEGS